MKRILACLLAVLSAFYLASCAKKADYRDDVPTEAIAEEIRAALPQKVDYVEDDSGFTDDYFTLSDSVYEHTVLYARQTNNLDEFGVYHVKEADAKELARQLREDYLAVSLERNREWYDSYIPAETPKLRDAQVRVYGSYVVYAILDKESRNTMFDTVERVLRVES